MKNERNRISFQFAIVLAVLFFAGLVFAQERAREGRSRKEQGLSYERVAAQLGLKTALVKEVMEGLAAEGLEHRVAVFFLVVAQERNKKFLEEERIEKAEEEKNFKESIALFLERRKRDAEGEWKLRLSEDNGLIVSDVDRRVRTIIFKAQAGRGVERRERDAKQEEFPKELSASLVQRLRLPEEVLRQAWAELEGAYDLRGGLMLLVLARERTDRFLRLGGITEEERGNSFIESAQFFRKETQRKSLKSAWRDLAQYVGREPKELDAEVDAILGAKPQKQVAGEGRR